MTILQSLRLLAIALTNHGSTMGVTVTLYPRDFELVIRELEAMGGAWAHALTGQHPGPYSDSRPRRLTLALACDVIVKEEAPPTATGWTPR